MTTKDSVQLEKADRLFRYNWLTTGLMAGGVAVLAVLLAQFLALQQFSEITQFEPLRSYPRTIAFVMIPALIASRLLAWLGQNRAQPVRTFIGISVVVLLLSFIPDFALPLAGKTVLASSVAAGLHVIAAIIIVLVLTQSYRRQVS